MELENNLDFATALSSDRAKLAAEITDEVVAQLPEEKARLRRELDRTAKEARNLESNYADGRGQAVASIPMIAYLRWHQLLPGCWKIKEFVDEFLIDNRECLLPGYKPKAKTLYFDMAAKAGMSFGAKLYWQNKERVNCG